MRKLVSKVMAFVVCVVLAAGSLTPASVVNAASGDTTVYITKTGAKYHASGCSSLKKSMIPISLKDAVSKGYEPCSKCHPGSLDASAAATNDTTKVTTKSTASAATKESTEVTALKTYKGNTKDFNAYDYYKNNADLQTAIGADGDALLKHYNDYGKAEGRIAVETKASATTKAVSTETGYVLNTNTKKFHYSTCKDVGKIKSTNYATSSSGRDDLINQGYSPCGHCHP